MNKEGFKILKEINSLNIKKNELQAKIAIELERIDKIQHTRSKRKEDLEVNEDKSHKLKVQLLEIDKKSEKLDQLISNSQQKINNSFEEKELNALNQQIDNAQIELDKIQEEGLELLEKKEALDEEITNAKSFLKGSLETIEEIRAEVNQENDNLFSELDQIEIRLNLLHEQIPLKASERIRSLIAKNKKLAPLAHISSTKNCDICGYLIPHATEQAVEKELKLTSCPGCTRILIPQSTKF